MGRLFLIRHGPSAHPSMSGLLDHAAIERWRAGYDACGIERDAMPPAELVERIGGVDRVLCSDLPRTMESARAIWSGKAIESTALLREVPLPIPTLGGIRAPFAIWATAIAVGWGVDILRGEDCPREDEERVQSAMAWCEERQREAGESATLAVVTHGVMRRLLATRLCERGWTMHGRRSYDPWSAWELRKNSAPL